MTAQTTQPADHTIAPDDRDLRTARITAALYLGLAITGGLGFLLIRPALFEPGDAAATLANLVDNPGFARLGVALEMGVVMTQALVALWFFRLFRSVDAFAAGAIAVFGMVNAVAILGSAAFLATALDVALEPVGDPGTAQLLYLVSDNIWGVGALFFGLWLIPMGWCVLRSGSMPRALGYLAPDAGPVVDLVTIPATIGEVWIIGHLFFRGIGRR